MATISTPVTAWVATLLAATGTNQSTSLTVTVNITAGWEVQIPVQVQYSNVSADAVVNVYSSMDGGANYETSPLMSFSLPSVTNLPATRLVKSSIRLTTGQYAIQLLASGSSSESFAVLTQAVITAINNV
jgi:hypothetical protein